MGKTIPTHVGRFGERRHKWVDFVAFMVYYWGMGNKSEVKELKLLVPKKIKDELVQSSKKNYRSMNSEANYILSKALGLEEE